MTKEKIDFEFTKNYDSLVLTASNIIRKSKKNIENLVLISETYLYLIKKQELIKEPLDVMKFAVKFMFSEVNWSNSQLNKKERVSIEYNRENLVFETYQNTLNIDVENFIKSGGRNGIVLEKLLEGYKIKEIAEHIERTSRTSKRAVEKMRQNFKLVIN